MEGPDGRPSAAHLGGGTSGRPSATVLMAGTRLMSAAQAPALLVPKPISSEIWAFRALITSPGLEFPEGSRPSPAPCHPPTHTHTNKYTYTHKHQNQYHPKTLCKTHAGSPSPEKLVGQTWCSKFVEASEGFSGISGCEAGLISWPPSPGPTLHAGSPVCPPAGGAHMKNLPRAPPPLQTPIAKAVCQPHTPGTSCTTPPHHHHPSAGPLSHQHLASLVLLPMGSGCSNFPSLQHGLHKPHRRVCSLTLRAEHVGVTAAQP